MPLPDLRADSKVIADVVLQELDAIDRVVEALAEIRIWICCLESVKV